jgi:hypothetical protein
MTIPAADRRSPSAGSRRTSTRSINRRIGRPLSGVAAELGWLVALTLGRVPAAGLDVIPGCLGIIARLR